MKKFHNYSPVDRRFWGRVDKCGPVHPVLKTRCWVWTGQKMRSYGFMGIAGRILMAHKYSWMLHVGPILDGAWVLHHCDNPSCVNPKHLFLGDIVSNTADKVSKGRQLKGERTRSAKLTCDLVRTLRKRYRAGGVGNSIPTMAKEFGLSRNSMRCAVKGITWRHVS